MDEHPPEQRLQLPRTLGPTALVARAGTKRVFEASPASPVQGVEKRPASAVKQSLQGEDSTVSVIETPDPPKDVPSIIVSEECKEERLSAEEVEFLAVLSELTVECVERLQRFYMQSRAHAPQDSVMASLYRKRPSQVLGGLFGRVLDVLSPPQGAEQLAIYSTTAKKSVLAVLWLLHTVILAMNEEAGDVRLATLQVGSSKITQLLRNVEKVAMDMHTFEVVESNGLLTVTVKKDVDEQRLREWSLEAALLCASLRLVRSTIADWNIAGSAAVVVLAQLLLRLDALYRWHSAMATRGEENQAKPVRGKGSEFISLQKTMRGANTVFEELFNDRRLYREEVPIHRHGEVLRHIRSLLADQALLRRMRDSGVRLMLTVASFYGQQLETLPDVSAADIAAARSVAHCLSHALAHLQYECDLKEMTAVLQLLRRFCTTQEPSLVEILLPRVLDFCATASLDIPSSELLLNILLIVPCRIGTSGIEAILSALSAVGKASAGFRVYSQAVEVLIRQVREYQSAALADICTSSRLLGLLQERLKEAATASETLRLLSSLVASNKCCMYQLIDSGLVCVVLCSKSLAAVSRPFGKMHTHFCAENAQLLEWRIMTAPPPAAVFTAMGMRTANGAEKFESLIQRTGALRRVEAYLVAAQTNDCTSSALARRDAYCQSVAALLLQDLSERHAAEYWRAERSHIDRALGSSLQNCEDGAAIDEYRNGLQCGNVALYAPDSTSVLAHRGVVVTNSRLAQLLAESTELVDGRQVLRLDATTKEAMLEVLRHLYGVRSLAFDSAHAASVLELCFRLDVKGPLRMRCIQVLFEDMPDADLCKCYHIARQWNDRMVKLCCLRSAIGRLPSVLLHRKLHTWPVSLRSQLVADCCDLVRALLP